MAAKIADRYKKLDHREHVLARPGMYVGSTELDTYNTWVYDEQSNRIIKRQVQIVPGLYKIFDEVLVNAVDQITRLKSIEDAKPVKNIKITIDKASGLISVFNDGNGIEIVKHPEHDLWIPEMIFGNLLTSTNYDDEEEKLIGGQNGIGAKACNIFSKSFTIDTVDHVRKKIYTQQFTDNMSKKTQPVIKAYTKTPYTMITFLPDYERFGKLKGMTDDIYSLFVKRCYDLCALTDKDINIWLNGTKLAFKDFQDYVELYIGDKATRFRAHEKINDRWEIIATYTDMPGFEQVSFVNGIWTLNGGKHVDYIEKQITEALVKSFNKKRKGTDIKPQHVKSYLMVFIKASIVNPTFDSQSKETLTTPASKFGSKAEVSDNLIAKLAKSELAEKVMNIVDSTMEKALKKTDGHKQRTIKGIPSLEDALWAGGPKSEECTLILTEGDSGASTAIAGLTEVGRERWGVFPLRGKLLNVKDQTAKKIMENEEINSLKKIIGLEAGKDYSSGIHSLRYGKIMLLVDSDYDGFHIASLVCNMFHAIWPSLFKSGRFITNMLTPIVKARKGDTPPLEFYSLHEFEQWLKTNPKGYTIKYYKGLGTSTPKEAKDYFKNMRMVQFKYTPQESDAYIDLAFNKKRADDRKRWLGTYERNRVLDYNSTEIPYEEYINKALIHFSNYDVERSIPNMVDGLKTSQRKILYCCFKKNLHTEIKVAQLAGYVSEQSAYHHGEASLQQAIIAMAQDFVGASNINLLQPIGALGSRRMGGKDAGAPRYVFTQLNNITDMVFMKDDAQLLTYLDDDGYPVEPEYYVPIIPMVLVNGALGIGTGFSTNVPSYNPLDIVNRLRQLLSGEDPSKLAPLTPWFRGFKGDIIKYGEGKYASKGVYERVDDTTISISELPVGLWTQTFKEHLEDLLTKLPNDIKSYEVHLSDPRVHILVHFASKEVLDRYVDSIEEGVDESESVSVVSSRPGAASTVANKLNLNKLESTLKLVNTKQLNTNNMYLFNSNCQIKKYGSPIDILKEFYGVRLEYYGKRKEHLLNVLADDQKVLENKIRFITEVTTEVIVVHKLKKAELEAVLTERKYYRHEDSFDYLLRIPIYNLTIDKVDALKKELADLLEKINGIKKLTSQKWWESDLAIFETAYAKAVEFYDAELAGATAKAPTPKAKRAKRQ
jgi:DNA topoisomerase-2